MAAFTHSLSLTPKTFCFHQSKSSAASGAFSSALFTPSSLKTLPKLTLSLFSINNCGRPSSTFVRNVAFSSELEEDESLDFSRGEEPNFSPDQKVFVGNLPFNVDSQALAGLFEQAGGVEMVEEGVVKKKSGTFYWPMSSSNLSIGEPASGPPRHGFCRYIF